MRFYEIKPKDKESISRRWFVDESGLISTENHYRNYLATGRDRWDEFQYDLTKKVWIDLGGMMKIGTPEATIEIDGTSFSMPITHVPEFLQATVSERIKSHFDEHLWGFSTRFYNYRFCQETKNRLKSAFQEKAKLADEMIEGFLKDLDRTVENNPHVRSTKKYWNK
jgi:hypothetical protein